MRPCLGLPRYKRDLSPVHSKADFPLTLALTRTDLLVSHELKVSAKNKLRLELNVQNLFNQKTATHIYNFYNRGGGVTRASSAINLASTDLNKGYDYKAMISSTADGANAYDPRYGMQDLFEAGTQGQFSVKFLF